MSEQDEQKIVNYPECLNIQQMEKILKQMKNCVCQILLGAGTRGSGFFCNIPYENEILKVLITNYHVINEKYIQENDKISLEIYNQNNENNKNIILNIPKESVRKIYLSPDNENDLVMIEVKEEDKLQDDNFLKLDDKLLIENSESIYESKNSIYTIQYPKEICVSYGILKRINKNKINHSCSTDKGSSGSPILSLETMKVIGVHKSSVTNTNFNRGIF